jgi:hypothetical protein
MFVKALRLVCRIVSYLIVGLFRGVEALVLLSLLLDLGVGHIRVYVNISLKDLLDAVIASRDQSELTRLLWL